MELEKNSKLDLSDNISMIPLNKDKEEKKISSIIDMIGTIAIFLIIISFIILLFILIYYNIIIQDNKSNKNIILSFKKEEKYEIDSNYERISPKDEKYIYIPIISTNDIHGKFFPELNEINIGSKKIKYKTGGLEHIAKYITTLRNEFGNNKVLYLDSGDQYFQSNETIYIKNLG